MSIGVIIADDEELSRALLVALLDEVAADLPPLVLMAQCATGEEVVRAVREHQPDIVFLDINMPAGDGFSVVAALGDSGLASPPAIISARAATSPQRRWTFPPLRDAIGAQKAISPVAPART